MRCTAFDLGKVDYLEAHRLQAVLARTRASGGGDILLLLEHPPTVTIGKSGKLENVLASRETLSEHGIQVFFTDRGGDVTYHGPGQLVGYPIIDLRSRGKDLHRYVHDVEEAVIRTVGDFAIEAHRDSGHRGVWVAEALGAGPPASSGWSFLQAVAVSSNRRDAVVTKRTGGSIQRDNRGSLQQRKPIS